MVDTGVDYNHEDLRGAMWDEGESYPSLVALGGGKYGINVAPPTAGGMRYDTTDPMDDDCHGTHVAGIVAAEWNKYGVSGAASGARIMAVKVMNKDGVMGVDDALRAYRYITAAQKAGVDVAAINNSWGDQVYSRALDLAVREAGELGAVSVFAAGNEMADIDMVDQVGTSMFGNPYAVLVANSNRQGVMSERSCYGKRTVGVFAPGDAIISCVPMGTGPGDETASPLVAGGITFSCDYETAAADGKTETGLFGFTGTQDTSITIAGEGHDSAHSLRLASTGEDASQVSASSKIIAPGDECRGLCFWVKTPTSKDLNVMLVYATKDGLGDERRVTVRDSGEGWKAVALPIAENADKENLRIDISFTMDAQPKGATDACILVDDMKLVSQTLPYDYLTGTSQASPAVAGAAAVLAAAFPSDDAVKRAARITGSVKPVADFSEKCISGGIFSLAKALAGDTAPVLNGASATDGSLTVEGFFFGADAGSVAIDGQALEVAVWSDTSIVARLPSGLAGSEKLVEVVSSGGLKGHQRFRIGSTAALYKRLPLPGRIVSGDPGEYTVTSRDYDGSFYAMNPRALVGLDGSLYYLLETSQGTSAIYRYDIEAQAWELAYEGGYAAGGGACTWDGKILFVAGQIEENKTYLGLFDPSTRTVEYALIDSECFERECTLVNTGKGVLLAGGRKFVNGSSRNPSIEIVRTVDPATMRVAEVELPEGVELHESWYSGAYDEQGSGYLFGGTTMRGSTSSRSRAAA